MNSLCTYFFLVFLKFSKGHIQVFVHMFISKELNCSLVDFPRMGKIGMFLFKPGIFDPVLHSGVHEHKCTGVKERAGKTAELTQRRLREPRGRAHT